MRLNRVLHVNISVDDVDKATAFYRDVLGLELAPRPADAGRAGAWFKLGELELHLSLDPEVKNSDAKRHVAFEVEDLEEARRKVEAAGLPIEVSTRMTAMRRFFIRDPAGNRIELQEK